MEAIRKELFNLIIELQSLNSLQSFTLAGGTSLSIRFNHRYSIDIDLFTNKVVGKSGLELIENEIRAFYKDSLKFCELINIELGDQYCFLRALISKNGIDVKIECLQNIQFIDPFEHYEAIRMISKKDIGILKLRSASNRKAKKDIYDLDYITDEIPLDHLFDQLTVKAEKYKGDNFRCLFDLDDELDPIANLSLLLDFDNIDYTSLPSRPSHSNDRIDIVPGNKSWASARSSWRRKVRNLMKQKGITPPPIKPIN